MTTFQKTKETYINVSKSMAYLAFKQDPTANSNVSFKEFCIGMDRIIKNSQNQKAN